MTGFIINNKEYSVGIGGGDIEYVGSGANTLGYSMYGSNIPEQSSPVPAIQVLGEDGYVKVIKSGVESSNQYYWDTGVSLSCEDNDTFSIEATYVPSEIDNIKNSYLFSELGYEFGWYAGVYSNSGKPWIGNYRNGDFFLEPDFVVQTDIPITYKVQGTADDVILTITQGTNTATAHKNSRINFSSYDTYKIGSSRLYSLETIFSGEMTKFEIIKNGTTLFTLNDL